MAALLSARPLAVPDCAPPYDDEVAQVSAVQVGAALVAAPPLVPAAARHGAVGGDDWPQRFARLLLEIIDGSRPARQLADITTSRVREHLRDITPLLTDGERPRVARVITTYPAPGVAESTVIVSCGPRTRALALRLERTQGRWICTDAEAG
jgi:hypothetical protein